MASKSPETTEHRQQQQQKLQIYPTSSNVVTDYWKEKYERDARRYWDIFYKRHQDKFFKDRHYLDKEWGHYLTGKGRKVLLEVGCGAGNTIYPLVASYRNLFIHAFDFSPRAVDLVKTHKDFTDARINAFVCDLTKDDLNNHIATSVVDVVTMIFVLSAVSPEKMDLFLQNLRKVLKPNGYILFRDYATGDLAQERFTCKDQKISENFYVRGDGTRAFYFSEEYLRSLFEKNGFHVVELGLCCKQVENRSRELVMNRRWIQAVFHFSPIVNASGIRSSDRTSSEAEVDMSDGMALDMFGVSYSEDEVINIDVGDLSFSIQVLSKEFQHTCKSTGLMLWESARLMAPLLARNPSILHGKRVLELGCGCVGICSMVSSQFADLVVATDSDVRALDLLANNVESNLKTASREILKIRILEWGNTEHIRAIKEMNSRGFDLIIGTDITYVGEAILPLFQTAGELISSHSPMQEDSELGLGPALILCHILRRVDEPTIISAAEQFGFRLVEKWQSGNASASQGFIASWFYNMDSGFTLPSTALNILYFCKVDTASGANGI